MNLLGNFFRSVGETLWHEAFCLADGLLAGAAQKFLKLPSPTSGKQQFVMNRLLTRKTIDGGLLAGSRDEESAKFALRKGLPTEDRPRTMAIENEPHSVDDFNGTIPTGYGAGEKKLLYSGTGIIKTDNGQALAKINLHAHQAKRAGLHYDFVARGIAPGTRNFEVNIPNGDFKGRYAFRQTFEDGNFLVIRMKDNSVVLPKPDIHLKPEAFLHQVKQEPGQWIVEQKMDGGLSNVAIHNNRAVFRSHRPEGQPYYDKLPALEFLTNRSRFWLARSLFPGPDLEGTVLKGELLHPDGAARVGGILNALPDRAVLIQRERGQVTFQGWDLVKFRQKDVSQLPYAERRELLEDVIREIRPFNPHWDTVQLMPEGADPEAFYQAIIHDPRGLPYSEGVVVKTADDPAIWFKIKNQDTLDLKVVAFTSGTGKFAGSLGAVTVETDSGTRSEVGSFQITDDQRQWIWDHRKFLEGQVAEVQAMEVTKAGAVRAGVFVRFHPSKSDVGLLMYSESAAGSTDPEQSRPVMYAVKSAAGWRPGQ